MYYANQGLKYQIDERSGRKTQRIIETFFIKAKDIGGNIIKKKG